MINFRQLFFRLSFASLLLVFNGFAQLGAASIDLAIDMLNEPEVVNQGDILTYVITVINNGPDTAAAIVITDRLADEITFVSAVGLVGSISREGNEVKLRLPSLAPQSKVEMTIRVTASQAGAAVNFARVESSGNDTIAYNNTITLQNIIQKSGNNKPPAISLRDPTSNGSIDFCAAIPLKVSTSDEDGRVVQVEYFSDGQKIGESSIAPFEFLWANPLTGERQLRAVATDDSGASSSAQLRMTILPPPLHKLIAPVLSPSGFSFCAGSEQNRNYEIQASVDLQEWKTMTNFTASSGAVAYHDNGAVELKSRFYRLIQKP